MNKACSQSGGFVGKNRGMNGRVRWWWRVKGYSQRFANTNEARCDSEKRA